MEQQPFKYHIIAMFILSTLVFIIYTFANHLATPTRYTINKTAAVYLEQSYRVDPSKSLSLTEFLSDSNKRVTKPFDTIPWGLKSQDYWLLLKLENKSAKPQQLYAHFDNPMIDYLTVYQLDNQGQLVNTNNLGDRQTELSLFKYSVPHISLAIAAQSHLFLAIKIDTTGISKTPINLYGEAEFKDLLRAQTAIWGIFVGVLIMAALYNLVLYFGIRDRVYLIYIGYILSALILMGSVLGFGFYLWPVALQQLFNHYIVVSNFAIAFFTLAFCTMFLRYHKDKCWRYKLSLALLSLMLCLGIASFFIVEYISSQIFFAVLVLLYIVCITLIYNKLRSGFRWAKFYVISWIPLIIGAAVQPLELTGVVEYSFTTRHAFLVAILCEVTLMAMALADRVRYQREKALYHATHTEQTKLLNSAMLKQAYTTLQLSQRPSNLCLIRITHFHSLNHILNQTQRAELIINVAKALELQLSKEREFIQLENDLDTCPRIADLGNGVLAFVSVKMQSNLTLHKNLSKIMKSLPKHYPVQGFDLQLSYSIGYCALENDSDFDNWLQNGYLSLTETTHLSSPISSPQTMPAMMNISLATAFQKALKADQLAIYHQPQIHLLSGKTIGSEALLRWPNAPYEQINIESLILLAERTGLINELTLWVLDKACQDIVKLNNAGFIEHKVSVNLSAKNLQIHSLIEKVENTLIKHNVSATQLKLELTESALIDNQQQMVRLVNQLTELGIEVILDDFGTGYSSLNCFVSYNFSTLKIDKSFIFDLPTHSANKVIVKAAIEMAHSLGLKVTAEGIEDDVTQQLLQTMGADYGQGYYYSKAIIIDDYLLWLADK
ncbi:EAL domain-containing protein [Pseudoalteromonas haloplanktis]|uniref:EAL domain-containing protein n=1 Tax=Pseudoalteromonas haloplanktis TaxID=228 RepID=A0ABU1BBQ6_PSEHA|nr:EAL domain-containing protein [Pseudoalteromonas haloplanktis]MDQ9091905.1 EAL domain-containing protein [Pseudoalteromonas haloplanktis]